jgi:hypothetical protein
LFRKNTILLRILGLLLALSLYSYHAQELLVCWLFFSLAFASLVLVILGAVVVWYAGNHVIHWASMATRATPTVVLGPAELHLKRISGAGNLK